MKVSISTVNFLMDTNDSLWGFIVIVSYVRAKSQLKGELLRKPHNSPLS